MRASARKFGVPPGDDRSTGETGRALGRIAEQVQQLNGVMSGIAGSAQEQATGLQQVSTAVNQMDQATQQNAAMVEQATAASHSLTREAETLAGLVRRFQIEEEEPKPRRGASASMSRKEAVLL